MDSRWKVIFANLQNTEQWKVIFEFGKLENDEYVLISGDQRSLFGVAPFMTGIQEHEEY